VKKEELILRFMWVTAGSSRKAEEKACPEMTWAQPSAHHRLHCLQSTGVAKAGLLRCHTHVGKLRKLSSTVSTFGVKSERARM
jgi:hypothetical protein